MDSPTPSRRSVTSGVAWAIPAIALGAAAPAVATSPTVPKVGVLFDGGSGANGALQISYLDLGLAPGQTGPLTTTQPITVIFNVVGLLSSTNDERDFTVSSSDGAITRGAYNTSTHSTPVTWVIPTGTSLPTVSTATSVPDVLFNWRDGLTGAGRLTNKIVIVSVTGANLTSPSSVPIDSSVAKDQNRSAISPDGIY